VPSVTGLVQRIFMDSSGTQQNTACVFIGPSPASVEILILRRLASDPPNVGAMKNSMLEALTQALASRREVTATFVVNTGITSVDVRA
jgi:hypothetical protein